MANPFQTSELLRGAANYPVVKGDVDGHPFHGNQWVDGGGISPQVADFITKHANDFYKSGGSIERLSPQSKTLANGRDIAEAVAEVENKLGSSTNSRLRLANYIITTRLDTTVKPSEKHWGETLIATDKDGAICGVLTYSVPKQGASIEVDVVGSTNEPSGVATALEAELAKVAAQSGLAVVSTATTDARDYHASIGRTLARPYESTPSSWTLEQCQAIAKLPIGP